MMRHNAVPLRILRLMVGLYLGFLSVQPAFAESESAEAEAETEIDVETEEADEERFGDWREAEAPQGTNEYKEIYQMRVLERTLLPLADRTTELGGHGVAAPVDPMGLSVDEVLRALEGGTVAGTMERGLQRQATKVMTAATEAVLKQLKEAGNGLIMPFGIDCAKEKAVQEYVAVFSSPGAGTMKTWLKRLARWKNALERVLVQEDVPLDLIYLAMIESGFKTRVKSPASAAGMWQFMAGTAVEMGLRIDAYVDERFDPIKSAHAAANYLKKQYARYHSWPLAMAAYNGGPGTVNVAIDRYHSTDYFKLIEYGAMYDETRRYVPRILAAALIGRNPAAFGFDGLTGEPPFVFDTVQVPGNTRLALLAEAAGCRVEALEELNPELLKSVTPPGAPYELRIPSGTFDRFVAHFDEVEKKYRQHSDVMMLRFGETLDILAEEIGTPARVLRQINGLGAKENVAYGSEVVVPNGSRRKKAELKEEDRPVALVSNEKFTFNQKKRLFYVTQKNDSVNAIAAAFGVMPNQLAIWNDLDVWAKLRPNMFLQIYVDKAFSDTQIRYLTEDEVRVMIKGSEEHNDWIASKRKSRSKAASTAAKSSGGYVYHTVGKGDSISKIAKKYGVSVESVLKLNKMKASDPIRKGDKIKVKKR